MTTYEAQIVQAKLSGQLPASFILVQRSFYPLNHVPTLPDLLSPS